MISGNDDLLDTEPYQFILYALLEGSDNWALTELVKKSKNYRPGKRFLGLKFGRVTLLLRAYNKCFCDVCVYSNLMMRQWFHPRHYYRTLVYKNFYIVKYQWYILYDTSLIQQAIEAASPYFKCCEISYKIPFRPSQLWYGGGADPFSSMCIFAPGKKEPTIVTKQWTSLQNDYMYWWLRNIKDNYFEVYTEEGIILRITDYPKEIKLHVKMGTDNFFMFYYINRTLSISILHPPYYNSGETKFVIG